MESFGELQVLVSFFMQMTVFISVLTLISTNIIVNEKNSAKVNKTISELEKLTLYVAYGILLLVTLLSPLLKDALQFESVWPFIVITLVFVVGIPLGFRTAYLRGKSDFVATSIEGIIASLAKIFASVALVLIGLKTAGAAGGILAAQFIALLYASRKAKQLGFSKFKGAIKPDWSVLRPQAKYAGLVLFVSLITTVQFTADVLVVKYLFTPEVAGQYAGIATISRIILFLTGSFAVVLLSSVAIHKKPKENSRLLLRSLGLTVGLGGTATIIFMAFPTQVVHVLFGTKFDAYAHLLPLLSVAIFMMSVANLLASYHIALRHFGVMWFVGLGALAGAAAIVLHNDTPAQVVQSIAAGSGVMMAGLFGWTGWRAVRK